MKRNLPEMIARWDSRFEHDRFISSFYQGFDEFRDYYSARAFLIDDVVKPIGSRMLFNWTQLPYVTEKKAKRDGVCIRLGILYIYICAACIPNRQ